jgi:hypothetical protein
MKNISFLKLIRFSFIAAIIGFLSSKIYELFTALLAGQLGEVVSKYGNFKILQLNVIALLYLWAGVLISALVLAIIFMVINRVTKYENMNFYNLYNYAVHTLFPCIVLTPLFGPLVMLLAIGFFLMALKAEAMGAKEGFDPARLLKKK